VTRDYKNISESRSRPSSKRTKKTAKVAANKSLPPWLWMLSGLIIGGFVSFLVFLKMQVPDAENIVVEKTLQVEQKPKQKESPSNKEEAKEDRFEFYSILPKREVSVPAPVDSESIVKESSKETPKANDADKSSYQYELQAGSFARFQDADRRKANLALIGVMSKIHAVESNDKTFYRVRVGPYSSLTQVDEIESILKQNKISSLRIKVKG